MEFVDVERVVEAHDVGDVIPVLEEAESATREGLWSVGYVAYEAAPAFDPGLSVCARGPDGILGDLPLAWFGLFRRRVDAAAFVGEPRGEGSPYTVSPWLPTIGEDEYEENARRVRHLIGSGSLDQINYALRMDAAVSGDTFELYRDLILSQRGGHGAFLDLGRFRILSASPHRFFATDGAMINVQPAKGTAPRGRWSAEDEDHAAHLAASVKDRAEHERIVDGMRRELAQLATQDTVETRELMRLERLETVWQLTSDVVAALRPGTRVVDVFRALFPSAAVTGYPKDRAMEAIAALETRVRGVYAGAIGFMAPTDEDRSTASFSVAVRTVTVNTQEGIGEYGVGAGVTDTSVPRGEYEEAQAKAQILVQRRPEISLYETIRWEEEHGFWWLDRHLERMGASAAYFGFRYADELVRAALTEAVVGMTGAHAVRLELDRDGRSAVTVEDEILPPARWWPNPGHDPVACVIDAHAISSTSIYRFHKTTARRPYDDRRDSHGRLDDVLLVNERGELTEATTHNVAVSYAGTWVTPPLASGCLPGVLRQVLIDEGALLEEVVMADDLDDADGLGLLSSVRGWRPARIIRR